MCYTAGHTGHGPMWSTFKSVSILLVSTALLAIVAELVVANIEPLTKAVGVSEQAIGSSPFPAIWCPPPLA